MKERTPSGPRRKTALVSIFGTTQLHLRHPLVIAWWSAAFPGFGHLLLSKYIRGYLLVIWEILINTQSHLNEAIVLSFTGRIDPAKEVLDTRWILLYIPVYLFAIFDSYRTSVDMNHAFILADREARNKPITPLRLSGLEVNYLDKRSPWVSVLFSLFSPGLGQLYIHRIVSAFFVITWSVVITYHSRLLEGIHHTLLGEFQKAANVLDPQWVLFMPSIYLFSIYDGYVNTVENNKLYDKELAKFLRKRYQGRSLRWPIRSGGGD